MGARHDALRRLRASRWTQAAGLNSTKLDDPAAATGLTTVAIERAKQGDEEAIRHLYARYSNGEDFGDMAAIRDAIAALPEEQRVVAFLRHVVGLSDGEMAEMTARGAGIRARGALTARRKRRRHLAAV